MRNGLTLTETLVVVAIVGSLASAVGVGLGHTDSAQRAKAQTHLESIASLIDEFADESGRAPRNLGELIDAEHISARETRDPWGRAITYRSMAGESRYYTLCSKGPDGKRGGEDDVCIDGH